MPLTSVEERLFAGLAAQAGLVLRGARLRAELEQRPAELSARADELRRLPRAAGRRPGRRAPAPRARHPRRRPAAPGRARGEPAAGRRPWPTRSPDRADALLAAQEQAGRRGDRDPGPAVPRHLPAAARGRGARRRAAPARSTTARSRSSSRPTAVGRLPPGRRGGGVLLLPGGAPERRQALRASRDPASSCAARATGPRVQRRGRRRRLRPRARPPPAPG